MTDYPEELLRGIPSDNEQFITTEGYPTQAAFKFDEYDSQRGDGFCELSINWVDDERAVEVLLNQINPRKNTVQFLGGYCRFQRSVLHAMKAYFDNGHLAYERRPIPADEFNVENPYHGNILITKDLSKQARTNIQATLACIAGAVIPRIDQ